ncbi:hypothetical protein D9M69_413830 [compost metagenome]
MPVQLHAIQPVQAGGIGGGEAQVGAGWLVAQVELAEGVQHWLETAERQHHLQRLAVAAALGVELHQQQLVVAVLGQLLRAEQLRRAADQPQQHRQQADTLAVDDDAQFQVEPFVLGRLVDIRIPAVHRRQVVGEARPDLDSPAQLAQGGELVTDEVQPGLLIRQLEHLRRVLRQRLALAQGDAEAEVLQLRPQHLFGGLLADDAQRFAVARLADQWFVEQLAVHAQAGVVEGQAGAMVLAALHASAARVVVAEQQAAEGQYRRRRQVVDAPFRTQRGDRRGPGVLQQLPECRGDVLAVVAHRAAAEAGEWVAAAPQANALLVDGVAGAAATADQLVIVQFDEACAPFAGVAFASVQRTLVEGLRPRQLAQPGDECRQVVHRRLTAARP